MKQVQYVQNALASVDGGVVRRRKKEQNKKVGWGGKSRAVCASGGGQARQNERAWQSAVSVTPRRVLIEEIDASDTLG